MNTIQKKERLAWIDMVRGFALLAIVYGHAARDVGLLSRAFYSFHVPLCVFLTGYLYEIQDVSLKTHLKKTGFRFLLPYVVWSLISLVIYTLLGRIAAERFAAETYSFKTQLYFMARGLSIGNAALWYLPFLFTSYLLMFLWGKSLMGRKIQTLPKKALVILLPPVFSLVTLLLYSKYQYAYPIDFPFSINNACFLLLFFWLGYVFQKAVRLPKGKKWLVPGVLLTLCSIGCALILNDEVEYMSFTHSEYGRNIPVFYISALTTSVGFCWLAQNLPAIPLLQWFGRNAMGVFVMHKFPVLFFQVLLGGFIEKMGSFQWLAYLGIALISMVLCCGAQWLILKICPWILGMKKKGSVSLSQ